MRLVALAVLIALVVSFANVFGRVVSDPCGVLQRRVLSQSTTIGDYVIAAQVSELPWSTCFGALVGGI